MASWVVDAFGSWYPQVYPHRDGAEAAALVRTLSGVIPLAGRHLLDVGCGTGRHLVHLARAGALPVGLDLSPALLAEAVRVREEAGESWPLVRGDMRALPFPDASLGIVTSLFTSFGYFTPEEDRRALTEAARVLEPGGAHVLDFLNRRKVLAHPNPRTERVAGEWRIRENRRIEGVPARVVKEVSISPASGGDPVAEYEERVTLYGRDELRALLQGAGLRVAREWGEYDGAPFDPETSSRHVFLSLREKG